MDFWMMLSETSWRKISQWIRKQINKYNVSRISCEEDRFKTLQYTDVMRMVTSHSKNCWLFGWFGWLVVLALDHKSPSDTIRDLQSPSEQYLSECCISLAISIFTTKGINYQPKYIHYMADKSRVSLSFWWCYVLYYSYRVVITSVGK